MELILELTGWWRSITDIISPNISDPFPKKSYNPIEKDRKTSGELDDIKQALVTTTDTVVKKGKTDMIERKKGNKPNVVKEAITPPISERKNIDKVSITEKLQASN